VRALLRYQAAIGLRSHRWIFPLIGYGLLIAVGAAGSATLAQTLDWNGAMLVPVVGRCATRRCCGTGPRPC
jgi:hypothetical protein